MPVRCVKCDTDNTDTAKFCSECAAPLQPIEDIGVTKTIETHVEKLSTGAVLAGRYQIIEELGKGGMGRVYKVHDKEVKEKVALKLLNPEIASDENTIERFRNELKIARKVSHKHVCRMHDLGRADGKYFITMEYVEGEDLKSHIRKKERLSTEDAIAIAKQVCEGLAEAHRLGVVHRDLKPQNIMMDKQGDAKIMDFGIARSLEAPGVTATGVIIGTPDYISPEQADGVEADQRSDIYSLGVILYEMVTGIVPFKGDTAFSVALKHKSQLPLHPKKLNADVSDDLSRLILICMEKDRDRRYQTAEELLADLTNIEEGFPLGTKIQPRRTTVASSILKNKLFFPALVIMIAFLAVLIWQLLPRGEIAAAPKIENSIAVIHFENLTGDPQYDGLIKSMPSLLFTKFEGMEFSYVATLPRLQDIFKQMGEDPGEPIDTENGFEVCRRDGVAAMAVGKITKAGNTFVTNIQVYDVETKRSLASGTAQSEGEDSLLGQIDKLAISIAEKLDWSSVQKSAVPSIAEYTTSSMEAYDDYLKGNEAFNKFCLDEARDCYLKAVEIDPTFAMAHLGLAHTHAQQGNNKAVAETMEKVMKYADKVNPKEKLYIEAWSARYVERSNRKMAQVMREIIEKYPREKDSRYWWGILNMKNSADEAAEEFTKVIELDPNYTPALAGLIRIHLDKREIDKANEYVEQYISVAPDEARSFHLLGRLLFEKGQLNLATEQFKRALDINPNYFDSFFWIGVAYAFNEDYDEAIQWAEEYIGRSTTPIHKAHGYLLKAVYEYWTGAFQKALDDSDAARVANENTQNLSVFYFCNLLDAFAHRALGNQNLARESFFQAETIGLRLFSSFESAYASSKEYFLGSLDLREGNIESAQERLAVIANFPKEHKQEWVPKRIEMHKQILEAEILQAEGSLDEAITLFEKLLVEYDIFGIAIEYLGAGTVLMWSFDQVGPRLSAAYEKKGELDKAIEVLENLIPFDPTPAILPLTPPKIYYDLGRLYEKKGMRQKARENYMRFLELWKNADPDLPEVEDAKAKLESLKN